MLVVGLDGLPCSLLRSRMAAGSSPALAALVARGELRPIRSSVPAVSSTAWAGYSTGQDPSFHGIFGFVDRTPSPFALRLPKARDLRAPTLWRRLCNSGRRVVVLNVPGTYPPEPLDGLVVGDFLSPTLDGACHPPSFARFLEERGWVVDVDAEVARTSRERFLDDLVRAAEARFAVTLELMAAERWDFLQLHVMETDRLFHFLWDAVADPAAPLHAPVEALLRAVDAGVGRLARALGPDDRLLVVSDHGFCALCAEVELNALLERDGFLRFPAHAPRRLAAFAPETRCYSLPPGRLYLNLAGREERGSVAPAHAPALLDRLEQWLLALRDPATGERIVRQVLRRPDVYRGPLADLAPDLVALPEDGYDLKARPEAAEPFVRGGPMTGTHTDRDALALSVGCSLDGVGSIEDASLPVLRWAGLAS